ncbi:RIP metalloprotease RseP [Sinisalibacter aestuarii]|uniref:Zinc metalloprotease n=1 Tax=Sinisalibacter aestuarii TaxID=2949426 RepID=A0ABQ5LRI9_9RHOB|nr:RIP metalloprotease RseP [Sinisalibacter aestuarii]GKY87616.1 zinc metalloprotease [Sinisalibacter aestuarii]
MDLGSLIPSFGNLTLTLIAFLLALIPIVFIHELGHYLVGRWSGIKADVFSIGAGPVLVSRMDKRGTRWQIAALPVGGYVRFHGDANAASGSADTGALSQMDAAERRSTLHGAPLWARAATVAAGPITNFIFSAVIFAAIALYSGVASDPLTVAELKPVAGVEGTLEPGDEIVAIDGQAIPPLAEFGDFVAGLPNESPLDWTVRRGGAEITLQALHPQPPIVDSVMPQSAAFDAGLEPGDLIETVNGTPIATFTDLQAIVEAGGGAPLTLGVNRGGAALDITLTPLPRDLPTADGGYETRWLIGIGGGLVFEPATENPGLWASAKGGVDTVAYIIEASISGIWHMVTGAISSCNLRGVITIAETSGEAASQGSASFLWFVAVLSTAVGLLNLFPIPVLDGGHLMFHAWEAVTGRAPSDKALNFLTMIGLALVLGIMVLGLANDLLCP